jgi:hypothetical protein
MGNSLYSNPYESVTLLNKERFIIMAKINGVEIKAYKTFRGHEGETLRQAIVYLDGKKIGYMSEGDWGGPMSLEFKTQEHYDIVKERLLSYAKGSQFSEDYHDIEMLFNYLLDLVELQKAFKKAEKQAANYIKQGYTNVQLVLAVKNFTSAFQKPLSLDHHTFNYTYYISYSGMNTLYRKHPEVRNEALDIFQSIDDFNLFSE